MTSFKFSFEDETEDFLVCLFSGYTIGAGVFLAETVEVCFEIDFVGTEILANLAFFLKWKFLGKSGTLKTESSN